MEETRQAFTLLSLFGLCVDAVVHNRVLPEAAAEGYFQAWVGLQQKELAKSVEQFGEAAHLKFEFQPHEVTGAGPLLEAGQLGIFASDAVRRVAQLAEATVSRGERAAAESRS